MLLYKELCPVLCLEADAEMEMDCEWPRSEHDSNIQPATVRIKLGINPFTHNILLSLLGLSESRVNLLGAEIPLKEESHFYFSYFSKWKDQMIFIKYPKIILLGEVKILLN